ncbi:DUF1059 domain-containing protein [Kallotenue papyrolyticum]|uniref:DUF1059 domain-containing protein n=1 Tax=Kallotenue papyrolyticum TaxID=1325125 RepID=UPI0004AE0978|nr:DUF1059 domain-containing protein [Kallotenue papyrolyticum]
MKTLRCRDVGFDGDKEIQADNEEEVMRQTAEHARSDHGVEITPEVADQVRSHIRDT